MGPLMRHLIEIEIQPIGLTWRGCSQCAGLLQPHTDLATTYVTLNSMNNFNIGEILGLRTSYRARLCKASYEKKM